MPQYPNNMHTSPNRPSPREVDERTRRSTYYDSDMFDSVPEASLMRNTAVAIEVPISQPHYQQQQRIIPIEQTRPPQANNAPLNRNGPGNGSRPPSYGNSAYEEALMAKPADVNEQRQLQQQQRRRGYRRTDEPGQEVEQIPAPMQQQQQQQQQQQSRTRGPPNPGARTGSLSNQNPNQTQNQNQVQSKIQPQSPPMSNVREKRPPQSPPQRAPVSPTRPELNSNNSNSSNNPNLKAGTSIPRLNSPSLTQIVLQPLDAKVQEYGSQMLEEEKLMAQIDAEMAALQDRRREADDRFLAAKMKHDDYRRQYQGVERALRGEMGGLGGSSGGNNGASGGGGRGGGRSARSSYDDEDDDRPRTQQTITQQNGHGHGQGRPPNTSGGTSRTESWGSVQKPKSGRFRMSKIFGAV